MPGGAAIPACHAPSEGTVGPSLRKGGYTSHATAAACMRGDSKGCQESTCRHTVYMSTNAEVEFVVLRGVRLYWLCPEIALSACVTCGRSCATASSGAWVSSTTGVVAEMIQKLVVSLFALSAGTLVWSQSPEIGR